jgi:hypothetical protein
MGEWIFRLFLAERGNAGRGSVYRRGHRREAWPVAQTLFSAAVADAALANESSVRAFWWGRRSYLSAGGSGIGRAQKSGNKFGRR